MSIVINLTDQRREDLIVTALEGGSNYWYFLSDEAVKIIRAATPRYKDIPFSERIWAAIKKGAVIPIHDVEDEDGKNIGEISLASIEKGEQLLADKHIRHLTDILTDGGWDATSADVWFQYCSLGELVYG